MSHHSINSTLHYRIAVCQSDFPYVMFDKETKTYVGYSIDILHEFQNRLNFTYEIYEIDAKGPSAYDILYKEIINKNADILLHDLYNSHLLEDEVDLTIPAYEASGLSILMYTPNYCLTHFTFLRVFEANVWFSIVGLYFLTSLLLAIFNKWSPYSYKNNKTNIRGTKTDFTFSESLWFCLINLTPDGRNELPDNYSGRLIAIVWCLFGNMVLIFFAANLSVFLAVPSLNVKIQVVEDLFDRQDIQYGVVENSTPYKYFEQMTQVNNIFNKVMVKMIYNDSSSALERSSLATWAFPYTDYWNKMFKSMRAFKFPESFEEAIVRVQETDILYALIEETAKIKYYIGNKCDFKIVGNEFSTFQKSFVVQKNSPLKEEFDKIIGELYKVNKFQQITDKWLNDKLCPNYKNDMDEEISIKLNHIFGLFAITFLGVALAYALLAVEIYLNRTKLQSQPDSVPKKLNHHKSSTESALKYLNSLNLQH